MWGVGFRVTIFSLYNGESNGKESKNEIETLNPKPGGM